MPDHHAGFPSADRSIMSNITGPWSKSRVIFLVVGIVFVVIALWMMFGN
jgi:hypothetical protein